MYTRKNFRTETHLLSVPSAVRAIETFESANYVLNSFGHIRNDFSQLNDEQNLLDFQRTLARMQEMQSVDENKDKTFEEIVSKVKPRWCQTPAELDRFEQYLIDNEIEYYNSLKSSESEAGASLDIDSGKVEDVAS